MEITLSIYASLKVFLIPKMDKELKLITGVVDHGLFIDMAHSVGDFVECGLLCRL